MKVSGLAINGDVSIEFNAKANLTYTVEYKDSLEDPDWQKLDDIVASPVERIIILHDPLATAGSYYQLVTPRQP